MCNKMSDVRLSNASPTVERVDARQQDNVRPPTRRNLFGTPDPNETRRLFEASLQENVQAFMEEYDFDPVIDRPLSPRRYDWREENDAPEFFRRPPHRRQQPQSEVECPGGNTRQDAEERDGRQLDHQSDRNGSRKRRSGSSGPCSGESQRKRSHSDEGEDDDDQAGGAACQAVEAEEERPSRLEDGTSEK